MTINSSIKTWIFMINFSSFCLSFSFTLNSSPPSLLPSFQSQGRFFLQQKNFLSITSSPIENVMIHNCDDIFIIWTQKTIQVENSAMANNFGILPIILSAKKFLSSQKCTFNFPHLDDDKSLDSDTLNVNERQKISQSWLIFSSHCLQNT